LDLIGLQLASSPTDSVSQRSSLPVLVAKSGLKLPKTKERWAEANIYFHSIFASLISQPIEDLDEAVITAQDQVYSYFLDICGTIPLPSENDYANKYDNQSTKRLKNSLRLLKKSDITVNTSEIKYLSAQIRSRVNKSGHQVTPKNHRLESELKTKFWPTCHKLFAPIINLPPAFSVSQCFDYFLSTLSQPFSHRSFSIPSWIPLIAPPKFTPVIGLPTYKAVATAVRKAQSSASACPMDQLSIVILKRCPILRTLLH